MGTMEKGAGEMKLGIVAYVPPPTIASPDPRTFVENLRDYKTEASTYLYSDYAGYGYHKIKELKPFASSKNRFAINNFLFLQGLKLAIAKELDYCIILETDVRVMGDHWDSRIWEEFFSSDRAPLIGGSLVAYNPCNAGYKAADRFYDCAMYYRQYMGLPMPVYGYRGANDARDTFVYPNGALTVFRVPFLRHLIGAGNTYELAQKMKPWDHEIGKRIWDRMGQTAYDIITLIPSVLSSYGDVYSTEEDRKEWLLNGRFCAVHQIKSAWRPS